MKQLVAQGNKFLEKKRERWRRTERVRDNLSSWELEEKVREKKEKYDSNSSFWTW